MKPQPNDIFYLDRTFDFSDPFCTYKIKSKILFATFYETIHVDVKTILKVFKRLKEIASWAPENIPVLLDLRTVGSISEDCFDLLKDPSEYIKEMEANIAAVSVVVDEENLE